MNPRKGMTPFHRRPDYIQESQSMSSLFLSAAGNGDLHSIFEEDLHQAYAATGGVDPITISRFNASI